MKNLYLKDLLLEIPTQVTNTTGSLTAIKGLLIQVRTLRQTSYIFRSCWRTAWSGKVFFILAVFVLAAASGPAGHIIPPSQSFPRFLRLNPSCPAHLFLLQGSYNFLDILLWFILFLYISYIFISELIPSTQQLSFSFYISEISPWTSHRLNLACLAWKSSEIFWIKRKFHLKNKH